jgi:hypothetical protein
MQDGLVAKETQRLSTRLSEAVVPHLAKLISAMLQEVKQTIEK